MGSPTLVLQPRPVAGAVDADRGVPGHRPRVPVGGGARRARSARRSSYAASRSASSPRSRRGTSRSSRSCPSWSRRCSPAARSWSSRRPETPLDAYLMAELLQEAGVPAGVVNIVAAGREVGEHLVAPPRRRQGRLHRLDRRRPQDRRGLRRAAQAGHPRARRQVGRDRARRRRPGRDDGGPEVHRPDELRPGLRRADPDPGPPRQLRRGRRRARRDRRRHAGRRPARPGHRDRPDGRAAPAGARRGVHRARPGGGRPGRHRRHRQARRASTAAGTSGPRSSPTSTTGCGSPRRRSSARCCR